MLLNFCRCRSFVESLQVQAAAKFGVALRDRFYDTAKANAKPAKAAMLPMFCCLLRSALSAASSRRLQPARSLSHAVADHRLHRIGKPVKMRCRPCQSGPDAGTTIGFLVAIRRNRRTGPTSTPAHPHVQGAALMTMGSAIATSMSSTVITQNGRGRCGNPWRNHSRVGQNRHGQSRRPSADSMPNSNRAWKLRRATSMARRKS